MQFENWTVGDGVAEASRATALELLRGIEADMSRGPGWAGLNAEEQGRNVLLNAVRRLCQVSVLAAGQAGLSEAEVNTLVSYALAGALGNFIGHQPPQIWPVMIGEMGQVIYDAAASTPDPDHFGRLN